VADPQGEHLAGLSLNNHGVHPNRMSSGANE